MSGAENGVKRARKSDERSKAVSGSWKKTSRAEREVGRSQSGSGVVSRLNLPLMAAEACCPLYSRYSALCSLQFTTVTVILEKVALEGSVECCAPPPGWHDLEL